MFRFVFLCVFFGGVGGGVQCFLTLGESQLCRQLQRIKVPRKQALWAVLLRSYCAESPLALGAWHSAFLTSIADTSGPQTTLRIARSRLRFSRYEAGGGHL